MKRLLSFAIAVIMILSSLTVIAGANTEDNFSLSQQFKKEEGFILGDADMNGTVNAQDAFIIKSSLANETSSEYIDAADISADGKINAKDVYYLKASFVGAVNLSSLEGSTQVYKFTIAGVDISDFTIVLPEDTTYDDNVYFAYELFWKYTEKATGVKVPMVYGATDNANAVYFHSVDISSELGEKLGYDGYRYYVENGCLHIYGTYRGNMYAVYEILEDYLGFYFCDNYYTYQFKVRCASLEEGLSREYIPPFSFRYVGHSFWGSTRNYYYLARGLNSINNSPNSGSKYTGTYIGTRYCHAHSFYFYQAMGAGVLPEEGTLNKDGSVMTLADRYYAKYLDGIANGVVYEKVDSQDKMTEHGKQPCTSNESEYNNLFEGLMDVIEMCKARGYDMFLNEGIHLMSFSINDGEDYCKCKICKAKATGGALSKITDSQKEYLQRTYTGEYEIVNGKYQFKEETYTGIYLDLMNRATKDLREYYPTARLYQIIYTYTTPASIRPVEGNVLHFCSSIGACFRHHYGDSEGCTGYTNGSEVVHSVNLDEKAVLAWLDICHENDCELWFWVYPENYTYFLFDLPVYYNVYENISWLYEHGIDGIYYEGTGDSGAENNFEYTRAYAASELIFNPGMTREEYEEITLKYLKVHYGLGYECVFDYLKFLEAAGQAEDFCCGYWYRAFDIYNKQYIIDHYEEMRNEFIAALEKTKGTDGDYNTRKMFNMFEFLGLSACYNTMYTNGTAQSRKTYEERYTEWFNWMHDNGVTVMSYGEYQDDFVLPDTIDFSKSPMIQIYLNDYRFSSHD